MSLCSLSPLLFLPLLFSLPPLLCFYPSHLLLIVSLPATVSQLHFGLHFHSSTFNSRPPSLFYPPLPPEFICFSLYSPLSLSFQSPLPSHLHLPSSLQFIPASVHLFIFLFVASFQYLPPSNLHAQLLILSLLFADLFNSSSLFLPAPPFFVTRLHFRLLLCVCSSVTFLMDFFGKPAQRSTLRNQSV